MTVALAGPTAMPVAGIERCMGTVFSFRVPAPGVGPTVLPDVVAWLHAMDATFSTYRADSEITRINDGRLPLPAASAEMREVLAAAERLRLETDGYFDVRPDGGRLDPSGYVKGWATQRAADMLGAAGSVNHCVNGGGDVVCAGRPMAGRGWRIGVADPFRRDALLTVLEASGPIAVATSGLAERGAHILDPHTGSAAREIASVSVLAADLITADVYATAAAAMGLNRARTWLTARPDIGALIVAADGAIHRIGRWPRADLPHDALD
jgi:thiamine biosynthesis lipoprotein